MKRWVREVETYCMRKELIFNKHVADAIKEEYKILKNE